MPYTPNKKPKEVAKFEPRIQPVAGTQGRKRRVIYSVEQLKAALLDNLIVNESLPTRGYEAHAHFKLRVESIDGEDMVVVDGLNLEITDRASEGVAA